MYKWKGRWLNTASQFPLKWGDMNIPDKSIIEQWKKEYGKVFLYKSPTGYSYIYRALRMGEYHVVSNSETDEIKEQSIIRYGVLFPPKEDLIDIPSGDAEKLITLISQTTNITEESIIEKVNEERMKLGMADDFIKWKTAIIKSCNYKPEEVDAMSFDKFIETLVMAEEVIGQPLVSTGVDDGVQASSSQASMSEDEEMPVPRPRQSGKFINGQWVSKSLVEKLESANIHSQLGLEDLAHNTVDDLRTEYLKSKKKRLKYNGG